MKSGSMPFIFSSLLMTSVYGSNRTVDLQWYGYSLCQFCFESANVVGNALAIDGLNELVSLSYMPVNHIASDGSYECSVEDDEGNEIDLDCEGTAFESCLVNEVCWYGDCDAATQQVGFCKCYEGPGANSEDELDPTTREPCLAAANFPSPNSDASDLMSRIQACQNSPDVLDPILATLNASKAEMVATTDYTVFPILYVNGVYQYNATWTALTRTLCDLPEAADVPECSLELSDPSDPNLLVDAVQLALNLAASNASLPIHFDTDDDALTVGDEFSYVNVEAVVAVIPGKCSVPSTGKTSACGEPPRTTLGYGYEFEAEILSVFEQETIDFVNNNNDLFLQFINYAFSEANIDITVNKASA